jgi:Uma2 family endonuclease
MVQDEVNVTTWRAAVMQVEAERRIVLRNIRWETYEAILADYESSSAPRFTYDRGELEIMSPMMLHEVANRSLARLVDLVLVEQVTDWRNLGSTTIVCKERQQGFEPDTCFYIQTELDTREDRNIDLERDSPPDLVIEIAFSTPHVNRLGVIAALGVPEVWRYDGLRVEVLTLAQGSYVPSERSTAIPSIVATDVSDQMLDVFDIGQLAWTRRVREWAESLPRP